MGRGLCVDWKIKKGAERVNFLNCNYPNKFKIPPGKPKHLKSNLSIIVKNGKLIEESRGKIWLVLDKKYYFGIEMDIKENNLGLVDYFETVGNINIELMNWTGETLSNIDEELIYKYLKMIK